MFKLVKLNITFESPTETSWYTAGILKETDMSVQDSNIQFTNNWSETHVDEQYLFGSVKSTY